MADTSETTPLRGQTDCHAYDRSPADAGVGVEGPRVRRGSDVYVAFAEAAAADDTSTATGRSAPTTPQSCLTKAGVYPLLAFCTICFSSVGPGADLLVGAAPIPRLLWRTEGLLVVSLAVIAVQFVMKRRAAAKAGRPRPPPAWRGMSGTEVRHVVVLGMFYGMWTMSFFVALSFTSVLAAALFNQLQVIIVLFFRIATCKKLPSAQYLVIPAILGGIYLALEGATSLLGNGIALIGSFAAVLFVDAVVPVQRRFGLMGGLFIMQVGVVVGCAVFAVCASYIPAVAQDSISFTSPWSPVDGVLGLLLPQWHRLPVIIYLVCVPSLLGLVGLTFCAKYVPTVVVNAVMLLEPVLGSLLAAVIHTGPSPSLRAYLGMALLVGASITVVVTERTPPPAVESESAAAPASC